ncbi:transposase, partial [Clostridium perfringens]|nr:transposase [Clostridium perfringens]
FEFKTKLISKCKQNNIELRIVDRFYSSSKTCSQCGKVKKDLKLSDRSYKCDCGLIIDRDLNASINLKNAKEYKIA